MVAETYHVIEKDRRYAKPIIHSKGTLDECWQYSRHYEKYDGQFQVVSHNQLKKITGQNCPC